MDKQKLLDQIKADMIAANVCPDLAKQATNMVFGSGNPNADVVFIGEAPGKNEDLTGEPFVGASGKFLDTMLATAGLERSDTYITSIIKYRPPKNRDPLPVEKAVSLPFLYAQLAAINPKLIVTLGRHSTNCFLPGQQISAIHGQPQQVHIQIEDKVHTWTILPLYHPAAALYNGGMRTILQEDFMRLPAILHQITNNTLTLK